MQKLSAVVAEPIPSVQPIPAPVRGETRAGPALAARALIEGYRRSGYRMASVNPLDGPRDLSLAPELDPRTYGLSFDESTRYTLGWDGEMRGFSLIELLDALRASYCGSIVLDCAHLRSTEQREWLHAHMEAAGTRGEHDAQAQLRTLGQLAASEAFEEHLRSAYPGYKQFSLEGSESIVSLLSSLVESAANHGVDELVLGMPHRGRINMMLNALGVPAGRLLTLYTANPDTALSGWDLKDHAGYRARLGVARGTIGVLLAHNPSHLESVSPVVCGIARALQDRRADGSAKKVMPVLIHGDASFCAQGIVTETLNLSQTRGYGVGGTVHVILNNQIGSTISHPRDARSTLWGADVARAIDAPIVHVNADDPDAVVFASKLATDFRMKFGADIVVDHIGYRRYGHFVGDDSTFTQPAMQRRIMRHRRVTELYAEKLTRRGVAHSTALEELKTLAREALSGQEPDTVPSAPAGGANETERVKAARTALPESELRAIVERLASRPAHISVHPDIDKMLAGWLDVARGTGSPVDWRLAENLAYGSLLANGFNIRLSGLDVGRGTYMHRQHVWHDQATLIDGEGQYVPLRHIGGEQGRISIFDSPLSEEAVLGFEYGYSLQCGRDLVVWEAQFGDFVNNAQVIIDQYMATGESKWNYRSALVCLLPHGHDGLGPEHSSAYLGRFLQLCAEGNMRVAMPTTAAQMYHLLRRQALTSARKPLVVMTPKPSLYRRAGSYSRLEELALGSFHSLIRDDGIDPAATTRAVVTSGKLYYDLLDERSIEMSKAVALLRAEELYPFPADALAAELRRFPRLSTVVWAQEEARNHGAWHLVREWLEAAVPPDVSLEYAGRESAAQCAVSDQALHAAEQRAVVAAALGAPGTNAA